MGYFTPGNFYIRRYLRRDVYNDFRLRMFDMGIQDFVGDIDSLETIVHFVCNGRSMTIYHALPLLEYSLKIYICDDKAQDMGVGDFVSFLSDRLWAYSDLDPRPRYNMFWSVILYVLCLL